MYVVAVASAVQAEEHDDRGTDGVRQSHRAGRERRGCTEEIAVDGLTLGDQSVPHDADDAAAIQALLHAQHRIESPDLKHVVGHYRVDLAKERPHQRRIPLVHQDFDVDLLAGRPHRPDHLEAAEMRAEQQTSAPARQSPAEGIRPP